MAVLRVGGRDDGHLRVVERRRDSPDAVGPARRAGWPEPLIDGAGRADRAHAVHLRPFDEPLRPEELRVASTLTAVVWIALVLVGPPALLVWLVRRRRRRQRALRDAAAQPGSPQPEPAVAPPVNSSAPDTASAARPATVDTDRGNGYMFPYGVPLVVYPLLGIGIASVRAPWMAAVLAIAAALIAIVVTRLAFNHGEFESARNNDPGLNLPTWRLNWLLFFALPPALLALFGLVRWLTG